jgi:hypothetical protein
MSKILALIVFLTSSTAAFAQPGSRVCAAFTTNNVLFEGKIAKVATVVEVPKDNFFDWLKKFDFVRDLGVAAAEVMGFGQAAELAARANVEIINAVEKSGLIKDTAKCTDKMMGTLTNALIANVKPHKEKVQVDLKVFTSCEKLGRAIGSKKVDVCDRLKRSNNSTSFIFVEEGTDGALGKIKFKDFNNGIRRADYK